MATSKSKNDVKVPDEVSEAISKLASGIGVAAGEVWLIFVRNYVVRGISELFTALVLFGAAWMLSPHIGYFWLVPVGIGIVLVYGAINYIGNPRYYALEDIVDKIQEFRNYKD